MYTYTQWAYSGRYLVANFVNFVENLLHMMLRSLYVCTVFVSVRACVHARVCACVCACVCMCVCVCIRELEQMSCGPVECTQTFNEPMPVASTAFSNTQQTQCCNNGMHTRIHNYIMSGMENMSLYAAFNRECSCVYTTQQNLRSTAVEHSDNKRTHTEIASGSIYGKVTGVSQSGCKDTGS